MKLLVTGGAGFIGSNFIRYYFKAHPDAQIINVDKLTYAANLNNLSEFESRPGYRLVRGDIADARLLEDVFDTPLDAVVHFAAETHVDRSIANARDFIHTNVLGTYTLLDISRKKRIGRFLHVSTDEVYGSLAPGDSADEQSSIQPNSPYAASKAASDMLVRSFWHTYRFPAVTTRCSNNYGPYQFPEKFVPLMITHLLEGKKLPVYGDGLHERDWIFVEDHCRAIDRVLEAGRAGEVYNIGFGHPVPNLEIVRHLIRIVGASEDLIDHVADRPGHDRRYALCTTKIRRELGWEPRVGLQQGLAATVEWYRANPAWVASTRSGEYLAYYEKFYSHRDASLAQL